MKWSSWQKEILSIMSKLFFCHAVFKDHLLKCVCRRERAKQTSYFGMHWAQYYVQMATVKDLPHIGNVKCCMCFNPFPHIDAFWHLCSRRLSKTLWQKEKLLNTSNFSFAKVFSSLFNYNAISYRGFSHFC